MFDKDGNQTLDLSEFSEFMTEFCRKAGVEFCQVVEFLILLAAVEDDPSAEFAFLVCPTRKYPAKMSMPAQLHPPYVPANLRALC